jgi:hypothetical protein
MAAKARMRVINPEIAPMVTVTLAVLEILLAMIGQLFQ